MEFNVATPAVGGAGTAPVPVSATTSTSTPALTLPASATPATFADKLAVATTLRTEISATLAALHSDPDAKTRTTFLTATTEGGAAVFKLGETLSDKTVADVLAGWKGPISLTPIDDTFNDKLDYGVDSWAKLEALNDGMLPVMAKHKKLYPEDPDVIAATSAFVGNYRAIHGVVTAVAARAGKASVVDAAKARLAEASARVAALAAELGATIGPPPGDAVLAELGLTSDHVTFLRENLRTSGIEAPALELLYQATADGVTVTDVLRCCKGKGAVLIVGRAAEGGWLFGGYMDCGISDKGDVMLPDRGGSTMNAAQSFVFTLTNPHGLAPTAWRRTSSTEGVYRNKGRDSFCFYGALAADPDSVLKIRSGNGSANYQIRGEHLGKVFTGAKAWLASDVLVFRV